MSLASSLHPSLFPLPLSPSSLYSRITPPVFPLTRRLRLFSLVEANIFKAEGRRAGLYREKRQVDEDFIGKIDATAGFVITIAVGESCKFAFEQYYYTSILPSGSLRGLPEARIYSIWKISRFAPAIGSHGGFEIPRESRARGIQLPLIIVSFGRETVIARRLRSRDCNII